MSLVLLVYNRSYMRNVYATVRPSRDVEPILGEVGEEREELL